MLELRNISFSAGSENGEKEILRNINLIIDEGFTVLTGPNGGGKSTLAKIISGIYVPQSGQILLDGKDITDCSITERANIGISFAFQQPVRFKGITVMDLISLAANKDISRREACEYLSRVGLCAKDYINREVNASLSGGELKRIEIASVLARSTKISIFDEPEAGIDLWRFSSLINAFENIKNETLGSVIIISHQERILKIADKIVVIDNGMVKKQGTKNEILPELLSAATHSCCMA